MSTHSHEGIFHLHRRQNTGTEPRVLPGEPNLDVISGGGNGGASDPGDFNGRRDDDPRKNHNIRNAVGAVLGVGAVGAAVYFVGPGRNNNAAPTHETTTSAPASTEPSTEIPTTAPATELSPSPSAPETQNPAETGEGMSAERVAEIDAMSYADFLKLDYVTEQVQYGVAKEKLLSDEGYLADFVDQKTVNNNSLANYNFVDNPTDETAGTDVVLQNLYIDQIIAAWKKANPGPKDGAGLREFGNGRVDKTMARKLASLYAIPGTEDYRGMIQSINNINEKTGEEQELEAGRIDDKDGSVDEKGHTDVKGYYGKEIMRPLYQGTVEINEKPTSLKLKDYLVHAGDAGDKVITYAAVPIGDGHVTWVEVKTVNPSDYTKKSS